MTYSQAGNPAFQGQREENQPQQPNLIDVLGKIALGAGVAAATGFGINRLRGRRPVQQVTIEDLGNTAAAAEETVRRAAAAPPPSRPAPGPTAARQAAAEEITRQARAERPQTVVVTDLSSVQSQRTAPDPYIPSPKTTSAVEQLFRESPSFGQLAKPAVTQEAVAPALAAPKALPQARASLSDYLTNRGYVESSQTNVPYSRREIAQLNQPEIAPVADRADQLLQDYELGKQRRIAQQIRAREMEIQGAGQRVLDQLRQESLVENQQARQIFNVDQAINALESGEDQATGRIKQQLQRNEDYDLSQIELLEDMAERSRLQSMEQDEPISAVAAQLPDGEPVIQQETTTAAQQFAQKAIERQRISREQPTEFETKVYDLIATAAQTGQKLDRPRAVSLLSNPDVEMTYEEEKLFKSNPQFGRVALRGQTYEPGTVQSGRIMQTRTADVGNERAKSMAERMEEEGYLSKPVGRGELRGLSALTPEARASGIEEVAVSYPETLVSTPETLEEARNLMAKAQSASRTNQLNELFTADTRPGLLSIRLQQGGVAKIPTNQFKRDFGPVAVEAIEEVANIQPGSLDYPELMQQTYGATEDLLGFTGAVGKRFGEKLAERGLDVETLNPYALHTLAGIARGSALASTSLSEYGRKAGRMEARGITSRTGRVPTAIPGPSPEISAAAVAQSTDPYQGRGTYTTQGVIQPAVQPKGGLPALDILERRAGITPPVASASPQSTRNISAFYADDYANPAQSFLAGKLEEQTARRQRQQQLSAVNARRFGTI